MARQLEFGIVGLGKIGANLSGQALRDGMRVVGFDLHGTPKELQKPGVEEIDSVRAFRNELSSPRKIFVYVPAGPTVDKVLDELVANLSQGDVIIDGGNSYWGDSLKRHERLQKSGIDFVDLGTSGGIEGAEEGDCFMAGGKKRLSSWSSLFFILWPLRVDTCMPALRGQGTS